MGRTRIDLLLVERGLFPSRAKARAAIEAGGVSVAGRRVTRPSEAVEEDAAIEARAAFPWVGRGALKLLHALELWPVAVAGASVLDLGASTGGFTEVCLAKGAARVAAVDVGRGQLAPALAADERVRSLEATDARDLTLQMVGFAPGLVVCDLSFIGLAKALPRALAMAAPGAELVALVKPQFEAGPQAVGKGGIVRDEAVRRQALSAVEAFLRESGWSVLADAESPVAGGDGNREFLVWARKGA